ncbi:MAG: GNAT family N-acetyltransferase [Chloroflexia bacterium]
MLIREATPADAPGIARVHVDSWRTTYKGLIPEHIIANRSYEYRERLWIRILNQQPETFVYVAEEDNEIVGFVSGGSNRSNDPVYKGELQAIYILEAYQGKGMGQRLTSALVMRLMEQGHTSMLLWVLADNRQARRFYEALGGKKVAERQEEMGDALLDELAYGWDDITEL